jgi:hypothetical protein
MHSEKTEIMEFVNGEIFQIHKRLDALDRRLKEAEERPQEILNEIQNIWLGDKETCPSAGKSCCQKLEPFEA